MIQNLQKKLKEKEEATKNVIDKLEIDNKNIKEHNTNLLKKVEALNAGFDADIKMKTKGLNDELINTTKELSEYKQENERLKHLELTSQNMVERLLKRLEQQIHSAENTQSQLNQNEKKYNKEIMRLEQINSKLQKHLTIFNNTQNDKAPPSPCSTNSD